MNDPHAPDAILARGIEEWNRGDFYEAHETLEDLADSVEDDDREHQLVLAIVHAAACLHKLVHDVGRNAVPGKLDRALEDLREAPATWRTLDLQRLRSDLNALSADLAKHGIARPFETNAMPRIHHAGE